MVIQYKTCCCGCSLKTGTLIIAWLSMIGAFLSVVFGILQTGSFPVIGIILSIVCSTEYIVDIMLIVGATNDRPHLLKYWIQYSIVTKVLGGTLCLVYVVLLFAAGKRHIALPVLLICPCVTSFGVYSIFLVNSFRNELISNSGFSQL